MRSVWEHFEPAAMACPGFLTVHDHPNGTVFVSARSRYTGERAGIEMSQEQLTSLALAILAFYGHPETGI